MKKILALALAAMMVLSMAACGGNTPAETTAPVETTTAPVETNTPTETTAPVETTTPVEDTTAPVVEPGDNASLEIMTNIWALYTDPATTPFVMGGSINAEGMPAGDGVPGAYDATMLADLSGILYIPEAEIANIDQAATAMHAMLANNFTAGVVHVTSDATAFANTMVDTLKNNHWMCGIPETLVVAVINGEYVLAGFGASDLMAGFIANMTSVYPEANVVHNGALA